MALTDAQIGTVVTVVGKVFSPTDPGLYLLVLTRVGLDMSKIVVLNSNWYQQVIDLVKELQRRGALRVFILAVLDKLPGNPEVQSTLPPLLSDLEQEDVHPAQTVAQGLGGLQASLHDAAVKAAAKTLESSLESLTQDIFTMNAYKLLHDCLHRLPAQLKIIEPAIRNISAPTFKLTAAQCQDEIKSLVNLGRSVLNGIHPSLAAERATEQDWLDELAGIGARLGALRKDPLVPSPNPGGPPRPNPLGIQIIHNLRSMHLRQPSRIDGLLTAYASTLELERLEKLFDDIIAVPAAAASLKDSLQSASTSLNQIKLQIQALIHRHRYWQKIDKELLVAADELPKNSADPGDFPALWEGIRNEVDNMIMIEPNTEVSTTLKDLATAIDTHGLSDWSAARDPFESHRAWCMIYFFSVDTELKDKCKEAADIGASLRNLLNNL